MIVKCDHQGNTGCRSPVFVDALAAPTVGEVPNSIWKFKTRVNVQTALFFCLAQQVGNQDVALGADYQLSP